MDVTSLVCLNMFVLYFLLFLVCYFETLYVT